jgi:hypothetical protein
MTVGIRSSSDFSALISAPSKACCIFPKSSNAYDSYAESLYVLGFKDKAKANYWKSYELNDQIEDYELAWKETLEYLKR